MLPVGPTASCGVNDVSVLFETFCGAEKTSCAWTEAEASKTPRSENASMRPQRLRNSIKILLKSEQYGALVPIGTAETIRAICLRTGAAGTIGRNTEEAKVWAASPEVIRPGSL